MITWHLNTHHIGRRVLVYDRTDSTNNRAAELAVDSAHDGLVILAREQTAGRGQYGRRWQAPPGSSVLLSVLLFPPPFLRRPALLTGWAALAVCHTIHQVAHLQATMKWPNDILIHGQKVCGILIEQRSVAASMATICGIGLNVCQQAADFAHPGLEKAISLLLATGRHYTWEATARQLIHQLDAAYHQLLKGDFAPLEEAWQARLGLLGRCVMAECVDGTVQGRLQTLRWDGLRLEQADGQVIDLPPERVRHLTPCEPSV